MEFLKSKIFVTCVTITLLQLKVSNVASVKVNEKNPIRSMIECVTGTKMWLYKEQGCWCKPLQPSGEQSIFKECCQQRRMCHKNRQDCKRKGYKFDMDCANSIVDCSVNAEESCERYACECDKSAAMCFKSKPACPAANTTTETPKEEPTTKEEETTKMAPTTKPTREKKGFTCFDIDTDPNNYTVAVLDGTVIRINKGTSITVPAGKPFWLMIGTFQAIFNLYGLRFSVSGPNSVGLEPLGLADIPVGPEQNIKAKRSIIKMNVPRGGFKRLIKVVVRVDEDAVISNINMDICARSKLLLDFPPELYDSLLSPATETVTFNVSFVPPPTTPKNEPAQGPPINPPGGIISGSTQPKTFPSPPNDKVPTPSTFPSSPNTPAPPSGQSANSPDNPPILGNLSPPSDNNENQKNPPGAFILQRPTVQPPPPVDGGSIDDGAAVLKLSQNVQPPPPEGPTTPPPVGNNPKPGSGILQGPISGFPGAKKK